MCKGKSLTDVFLNMLKKCNAKAEVVRPKPEDTEIYQKYKKRINNLINSNYYRLALDFKRIGEVYLEIKFMLTLAKPLGDVIL
jgi:hypothetical protein